jgi:hypothetical protein
MRFFGRSVEVSTSVAGHLCRARIRAERPVPEQGQTIGILYPAQTDRWSAHALTHRYNDRLPPAERVPQRVHALHAFLS